MNHIAPCALLAEFRHHIDHLDCRPVTLIAAFTGSERQDQAALHPPSPKPN